MRLVRDMFQRVSIKNGSRIKTKIRAGERRFCSPSDLTLYKHQNLTERINNDEFKYGE